MKYKLMKNTSDIIYLNGFYQGKYKKKLNYLVFKKGCFKFFTSEEYTGQFNNNKYNGKGVLIGNRYKLSGNWINNNLNGNGIIEYNDIKYNGEIQNNIPNGVGKLITGEYTFIGEFQRSIINGYGVLKKKNQIIYSGKWKNNFPNGKGKYYINKIPYKVHIVNGKFSLNGIIYDLNININKLEKINFPIPLIENNMLFCDICYKKKNLVETCSHLSLCEKCAKKIQECPICGIKQI